MIHRIVKMIYRPEHIDEFKEIFSESSDKISGSKGCISLRLVQDKTDPRIFFTYSLWEDESSLEEYRNSETFKAVWPRCKKLFDAKPEAWSTHAIYSSSHGKDRSR